MQAFQSEKISDCKFRVLDTTGKDLMNYKKKYILVIDKKPFSLNNYEETLEDLMALNFIMKSEEPSFNYTDIVKSSGKSYYYISEETYKKINKLKNIKGIYTYIYDETDKSLGWSVGNLISSLCNNEIEEDLPKDSVDEIIKRNTLENKFPKDEFSLDNKSQYVKNSISSNNKNLELTIDKEMNDKVCELLNDKKYDYLKNIGVLIMESDTGKIRVMAQKDESQPNVNLAIEGSGFEPGSVFKLITVGAALDKGLITMDQVFNCTGKICKHAIHGKLTVNQAIVSSCNDIIAQIGNEVGYDTLMDYAERAGLFKEVLGIFDEGHKESLGLKPTKESGINNISIGQCMTVTPVQVLGFTNSIVNDGVYIKPYIIDKIIDDDDNVLETLETKKERIFSSTSSKLLKKSMINVVENGTGVKAKTEGILIGGKTGSATSSNNTTHCWFSGFFKLKGKTYTMTVFVPDAINVDDERGGGDISAPIFSEVVKNLK